MAGLWVDVGLHRSQRGSCPFALLALESAKEVKVEESRH